MTGLAALARLPVVGSGVGMVAARVVNMLLGLALAVVLTRLLGVSGFGAYAFALAAAMLLGLPAQMGLPTFVLRETARAQGRGDRGRFVAILAWATTMCVLSSLGVLAAVAGAVLLPAGGLAGEARGLALAAAVLVLPAGLLALGAAALNGLGQPLLGTLADAVVRPALLIVLVLLAALAGIRSPEAAMALQVLAAAVAASLTWLALAGPVRRALLASTRRDRAWTPSAFLASLGPLTLGNGLAVLNGRLDVVMVGLIAGASEVALYVVATQVASAVLTGQGVVNAQLAPRLARSLDAGAGADAQRVVSWGVIVSGGLGIAAALAVAAMGRPLLGLAFGEAFVAAFPALIVLVAAQAFASAMGPTALTLNMAGLERLTLRATALSLAVNVTLNLPLVFAFGAAGAAMATLAALVVAQVTMMVLVRRRLGLSTHLAAALPLAAGRGRGA